MTVNMLHGFGVTVRYERLLRVETVGQCCHMKNASKWKCVLASRFYSWQTKVLQETALCKIHQSYITACSGATTVHVCSPDTDVLVLLFWRYHELCQDTSFVTGVGQNHRIVKLGAVYSALSAKKTAALPSFHALSGADVTGSFAGKGKCHAEMCLVMHQRRH